MIVSCNMLLFLYHRSSSSSFCSLHSLISEISEEALLQEAGAGAVIYVDIKIAVAEGTSKLDW